MFYAEEGISSDKKAQKELDDAWDIVKEKKNYGYGYDDSNSIAIIWEIVDREFNPGYEQQEYDFNEMVAEIRSKNDEVFGYEEKAKC